MTLGYEMLWQARMIAVCAVKVHVVAGRLGVGELGEPDQDAACPAVRTNERSATAISLASPVDLPRTRMANHAAETCRLRVDGHTECEPAYAPLPQYRIRAQPGPRNHLCGESIATPSWTNGWKPHPSHLTVHPSSPTTSPGVYVAAGNGMSGVPLGTLTK